MSSTKPSCFIVSPWRMLKNPITSAPCSLQTAMASRRLEAGLILPIPHSLACAPVFGCGVKYRCVQMAGPARQWCAQFCSTIARHVRVADERTLEAFDNDSIHRILHFRRRDCVPSVKLPYKYIGTARAKKAPLVWSCSNCPHHLARGAAKLEAS